jgi:hypothetical protein
MPNSGAIAYNPNQQPNNTFLPPGQTALTQTPSWISGPNAAQTNNLQVYVFDEFNKLFGRNPSQSELDQFTNYYASGDPNKANDAAGNSAISSYFNQQQQAANAPQQEATALQNQIPIIQNLINSQTQATTADLTNPNSPTYQSFAGLMNNMGITPSAGAFQAGLGGQIGQNAANATNAALGAVGLPLASTYSQGATTPFTTAMNQPGELFSNNLQLQNLITEMGLLPKQGGNGMWGDIIGGGLSGAAAGGAKGGPWGALAGGAAGAGGGYAKSTGTWICTELCERGLLTRNEVEKIHAHLFKAKWKKPWLFLGYFVFGTLLVFLANKVNTAWNVWKPEFYDQVMQEPDPVKALALYEQAFWSLFRNVRRRLGTEISYGF